MGAAVHRNTNICLSEGRSIVCSVASHSNELAIGLFAFDELIEDAICAKAISSFGGVVLGDSSPLILSDSAAKDAPGRTAWLIEAIVPAGIIAEAVL